MAPLFAKHPEGVKRAHGADGDAEADDRGPDSGQPVGVHPNELDAQPEEVEQGGEHGALELDFGRVFEEGDVVRGRVRDALHALLHHRGHGPSRGVIGEPVEDEVNADIKDDVGEECDCGNDELVVGLEFLVEHTVLESGCGEQVLCDADEVYEVADRVFVVPWWRVL